MPEVHFVGEISTCSLNELSGPLSVSYGVVPGNGAWSLSGGNNSGETQISVDRINEMGLFSHPLDMHYATASSEGWPFFVVEVWERSYGQDARSFCGCGCVFLPTSPGKHILDINLWRPCKTSGLSGLYDMILPKTPSLRHLREIIVKPYIRSTVETDSVGTVRVEIHVVVAAFKENGVVL
jgi:B9 domain-containing protein 2